LGRMPLRIWSSLGYGVVASIASARMIMPAMQ